MPEKTFTNQSNAKLQLTLFVRQGNIPYLNSESVAVEISPGETVTVTYGDASNPYLNGVNVFTASENDLYNKVQFITALQSELDTLLNTNNLLSITEVDTDYVITGSNPNTLSLNQMNAAQTASEIQDALLNSDLGLDTSVYNTLSATQQEEVATTILTNRSVDGYETVQDAQTALNNAMNALVNAATIYVQQGATGDGSRLNPFGTIEEGLAAVSPNGTVKILSGTYPITSQINVNTEGVTLRGEPETILLLQADVTPLLITASNTTLEGLTITSDVPYAVDFIQVAGANTRIIDNTIFGPEQPQPMSDWITNRAIVSQGNVQNLLVEHNTIYSLQTGLYIHQNINGMINENTIYNTKGGIFIDGALIVIEGNDWGIQANEFDIVLLVGTTTSVPYENVVLLSSNNNSAIISDQR